MIEDLSFEKGRPPVLVAAPGRDGAKHWLTEHAAILRSVVRTAGAVLVRGLDLRTVHEAALATRQVVSRLMMEREPFAPRSACEDGVWSASAWPPDQPMCMHHELSYLLEVPRLQTFCCLAAPSRGGATALADGAAVLRDLPAVLVDRFERVGWELLRAHHRLVGMPWREAFGTDAPAAVERYCLDNDIEWCWEPGGGLRTRRRRAAIVRHPVTGDRVWFNQIAFLSEWTMEPEVRAWLMLELGSEGLPFNTRYGDGEPLDPDTVDLINEVYASHAVREPWRSGDLLVVDNIRMAHSREPFDGPREVVVAMGDPVRLVPFNRTSATDTATRPG